ncbi:MAG: flagellar biosynthesis protein FlhB [Spartobacteria bacterium]|nr:flagellar biosynthesis protein FlhB [Spartobacteria bacterium]
MEGKDGRTEKATPKKRNKAREKGQMCLSSEITSMAVLFFGLIGLRYTVPFIYDQLGRLFIEVIRAPVGCKWTAELVQNWYIAGIGFFSLLLMPIVLPVIFGAVAANMGQTGPFLSMKAMKFSPGALNPIKGVKRLFSFQSILNVVLSMLKVALIAFVIYLMLRNRTMEVGNLAFVPVSVTVLWIFTLVFKISITVVVLFVFVAVLDWLYRKYKHEKDLMMTKEEVKEERKQYEPNPLVKRAQRKKMMELSMLRMMAEVPKADVVITNPTHVAVALKYDPESMDAPRVVAKGLRLVAQRIKEIARENGIPIIEKPAVARGLYKHVSVGQTISAGFYEAVAEILAYMYRLKHGGLVKRAVSADR